jgi:MFS family permease
MTQPRERALETGVETGLGTAPSLPPSPPRILPLAALMTAHAVSLTGNMLMLIALPLYVLNKTGSASATGLAGVFVTLPVVVGGLLGGVLVDRFGYRRSSVVADLTSGLVIAVVPLLGHSVGLPFGVLLALVFVSGLLDAPGQNARSSLLPEAAAAGNVPIERAIGWFEAAERGARLAGAPLAGVLVLAFGALNVLAVDAVTFVVSAGLVLCLVPRRFDPLGEQDVELEAEVAGYWTQLRQGLAFAAREPLLRAVVLVVVVTNLFDSAFSSVLLPVYAQRQLGGAVDFGLLVGVMGGGALAGSLLFGAIGHRLPRRGTFIVAFTLAGGPFYFALAAGLPFHLLLVLKLLAGFCAGAVNPIIGIIELERIPVRMRARVFGLINAGCWAAMPIGSLFAGVAVDRIGLTRTLLIVGTGYLIATLSPLRGGAWRTMDAPAPALPERAGGTSRP